MGVLLGGVGVRAFGLYIPGVALCGFLMPIGCLDPLKALLGSLNFWKARRMTIESSPASETFRGVPLKDLFPEERPGWRG